jgi:hypothetical protein
MSYYTERFTRLDYCQFLLSSLINYSLTYFAEHAQKWSHDTINRYLKGEKITPRLVWEKVQDQVIPSEKGYLIFDDTVADKNHSRKIETVRRQWSGNAGGVIRGIGIVTCVYVNPEINQFWIIDFRIFNPEDDGKSKIDHLHEMLDNVHFQKQLSFQTVLMDSWYASRKVMRHVEKLDKIYYCPLKKNRLVDETDGAEPYQRVENLTWSKADLAHGKSVHLKKFPKGHRLKLFRLEISTDRTDYIVTNDVTQNSADDTQQECGVRWKIEQFHREAKQTTGIERCQCRSGRIQRNHIGCAMLVWVRLKEIATQFEKNIYRVKFDQLSAYLIQQLKTPSVQFA